MTKSSKLHSKSRFLLFLLFKAWLNRQNCIWFKLKSELYKHSVYAVDDETNEKITENFAMYFYEMKKISDKIDTQNSVKLWLQLIRAETIKELEMIKKAGNPTVAEAVDIIEELNADEKFRFQIMQEEMRRRDKEHDFAYARDMGKEEGINKERERWIAKIKASGLTQDQINQILN